MPLNEEFLELKESIRGIYLGRPVPRKYQKRYGKFYEEKDIENLAYAIAKSKGIKID